MQRIFTAGGEGGGGGGAVGAAHSGCTSGRTGCVMSVRECCMCVQGTATLGSQPSAAHFHRYKIGLPGHVSPALSACAALLDCESDNIISQAGWMSSLVLSYLVLSCQILSYHGCCWTLTVHAAGGGAASSKWMQIRQAKLPVPVIASPQAESAYGAAMLAREGWLRNRGQTGPLQALGLV